MGNACPTSKQSLRRGSELGSLGPTVRCFGSRRLLRLFAYYSHIVRTSRYFYSSSTSSSSAHVCRSLVLGMTVLRSRALSSAHVMQVWNLGAFIATHEDTWPHVDTWLNIDTWLNTDAWPHAQTLMLGCSQRWWPRNVTMTTPGSSLLPQPPHLRCAPPIATVARAISSFISLPLPL